MILRRRNLDLILSALAYHMSLPTRSTPPRICLSPEPHAPCSPGDIASKQDASEQADFSKWIDSQHGARGTKLVDTVSLPLWGEGAEHFFTKGQSRLEARRLVSLCFTRECKPTFCFEEGVVLFPRSKQTPSSTWF